MKWTRRRRAKRNGSQVAAATAEAEKSRDRLEEAHRTVIDPLRRAAERNQFADMIRDSLLAGYHRREDA